MKKLWRIRSIRQPNHSQKIGSEMVIIQYCIEHKLVFTHKSLVLSKKKNSLPFTVQIETKHEYIYMVFIYIVAFCKKFYIHNELFISLKNNEETRIID